MGISRKTKLQLYNYFIQTSCDEKDTQRHEYIKNLLSDNRKNVVVSLTHIFQELKQADINITNEFGEILPYNLDGDFIWGKFYAIHSSGNIKNILKNRKEYIKSQYDDVLKNYSRYELTKDQIEKILKLQNKKWILGFITDGVIDDFKLYNSAFKFISNVIEYRIPFYIGFYVSVFRMFSKKKNYDFDFSFDVVDISTSLENKNIDKKYNNMLEFGLPLDMIKKISENSNEKYENYLDEYEQIMLKEYQELCE